MKEIKRLVINDLEIIEIDYSNCPEDKMIDILAEARALIRKENKPQRVLAIFNERSFLTPKVMKHFNADRLGSFLLERQAAIGVSVPKRGIIKGNNVLEKNDIRIFESKSEAIDYLTDNEKE